MNCNIKGCNECIFYNARESICMRRKLSATANEVVQIPILTAYIFTLKKAYYRYKDFICNFTTERDKAYWCGQADCILAIFNDLGFGYLLY